ncbi:hypothetical protein BBJ28_00001528 [Nothophytophthora sp. Chile5]|nr:hypothetical protein BBJ28_00001528 [Nothophytophthora sp. Chile5]
MRYNGVALFIDATFKVTPKPLYQTLIAMVYDRARDLYLLCFYILTEAKDHWVHYHACQCIKVQCDQKCVPAVVVCDFEGLCKSLFETTSQLLYRRLLVPLEANHSKEDDYSSYPSKPNQGRGGDKLIPSVANILYTKIDRVGHKTKWDQFWGYFTATWLKLYKPSCWNISAMKESRVAIVNRTNNPLEAYNRALADRLGTIHPGMLTFVEAIELESVRYLSVLEDVRHQRVEQT